MTALYPVESNGDLLRYFVPSRSRQGLEFLVDLLEYDGNGRCSCENFQFRLQPLLEDGFEPSDALRCFHIREARRKFLDDVISGILCDGVIATARDQPQPRSLAHARRIAPISDARKERLAEYEKIKRQFLRDHPQCAVFLDLPSEDVHHVRGRTGSLLTDTRYWIAVSRRGHQWIHNNIAEARKRGFIAASGEWLKEGATAAES